jgi:hypothetical protein
MAAEKEWKVLLKQSHHEKPGDVVPRVGEIIVLQHGPVPVVARIAEILPATNGEAGTLVVEPPFTQ